MTNMNCDWRIGTSLAHGMGPSWWFYGVNIRDGGVGAGRRNRVRDSHHLALIVISLSCLTPPLSLGYDIFIPTLRIDKAEE